MSADEVKPGMFREPFSTPDNVLVMVAGTGAGNSMVFQVITGSTAPHAEEVEEPRPYMNKVIHGATLTKYGRVIYIQNPSAGAVLKWWQRALREYADIS